MFSFISNQRNEHYEQRDSPFYTYYFGKKSIDKFGSRRGAEKTRIHCCWEWKRWPLCSRTTWHRLVKLSQHRPRKSAVPRVEYTPETLLCRPSETRARMLIGTNKNPNTKQRLETTHIYGEMDGYITWCIHMMKCHTSVKWVNHGHTHIYKHIWKQCWVTNPYIMRPFLLRSQEAKLNSALLMVQTYWVRPKGKDGQDDTECRTVVPSGRQCGMQGEGLPGRSQFSWKPFTSQALNHGSSFYYYASQFSHLLCRIFIQIKYCIIKRRDLMKWYMKSSWQRAQLIQIMPARIARALSGVGHGTK